jgi:transposase, IS30 family
MSEASARCKCISPRLCASSGRPPKAQPGHWEGDLIIGKDQGSAIGTLVERQTRMVRLLHLPQRDGDTLHDALMSRMADLPAELLRSITWDQGNRNGAPPHDCPLARRAGLRMKNTNGLLLDYFPNELNNRPRIVLNDRTPAELF